jgi:hypothetical protein
MLAGVISASFANPPEPLLAQPEMNNVSRTVTIKLVYWIPGTLGIELNNLAT